MNAIDARTKALGSINLSMEVSVFQAKVFEHHLFAVMSKDSISGTVVIDDFETDLHND